ncbi:hypothetical protein R3P38DRAFT_3197192 [Favolaschia claudopus]|uniref:Uncharacterized protein n=1 Tax=Favolaschia claudopus TaxID=2862362 RepID=A0AAW0B3W7_9AGAR
MNFIADYGPELGRLRESDYPAFLRELKEKDIGAYLDVLHEDYEATEASQRKKDMERKKGRKKSRKTRPLVVPMKIDSTGTEIFVQGLRLPANTQFQLLGPTRIVQPLSLLRLLLLHQPSLSISSAPAPVATAPPVPAIMPAQSSPVRSAVARVIHSSSVGVGHAQLGSSSGGKRESHSAASECTICLSPLNGKRYHNMLDPLSGWVCRACYEYHRKHSKQRSKELIERARAMRDEDGGARACGLRAPMHGKLTHTATTLALNRIFSESPTSEPVEVPSSPASSESAMESFKAPYIDMCEQWTRDQEAAKKRGTRRERARGEEASTDRGEKNQSNSEDDASNTDERRPSKRRVSAL